VSVESVTVHDVTGGIGASGERTYQKVYRVLCSSNEDGPVTARNGPGIERYGQAYAYGNEADLGAWAVSIIARKVNLDELRRDWFVQVDFSSAAQQTGESIDPSGDPIDNALDRSVRWSGSFAQFAKAAERDRLGFPIVNTVGDPIEGITKDDSRPELIARRNVEQLDLAVWADYRDKVNADAIWGLEPRMLKVNNITWETQRAGDLRYFEVTYAFHANFEKWINKYENRGWRARPAMGADPVKITDIVEPAYLDDFGVRLSQARIDAGDFPDPIEAELEDERSFSDLGLPDRIEA